MGAAVIFVRFFGFSTGCIPFSLLASASRSALCCVLVSCLTIHALPEDSPFTFCTSWHAGASRYCLWNLWYRSVNNLDWTYSKGRYGGSRHCGMSRLFRSNLLSISFQQFGDCCFAKGSRNPMYAYFKSCFQSLCLERILCSKFSGALGDCYRCQNACSMRRRVTLTFKL